MSKKPEKVLKLQIRGGQANPAPPLGPALGQAGVNISEFVNQFNAATQDRQGELLGVVLNVYSDRSFDFVIKTSPVSAMIKKELGISSGSGNPNRKKVGKLSKEQVEKIAKDKMPDLNTDSLEAAVRIVAGTARSMGVDIDM